MSLLKTLADREAMDVVSAKRRYVELLTADDEGDADEMREVMYLLGKRAEHVERDRQAMIDVQELRGQLIGEEGLAKFQSDVQAAIAKGTTELRRLMHDSIETLEYDRLLEMAMMDPYVAAATTHPALSAIERGVRVARADMAIATNVETERRRQIAERIESHPDAFAG